MLPIHEMNVRPSSLSSVLGLALIASIGCSDLGGNGAGGMGGTAGTGGSGGASGGSGAGGTSIPGGTVPLSFSVSDWTTRASLEGVEICELDTLNCVLTDAQGRAILDLPKNQEVALTLEKEGYGPLLGANVTDEEFSGESEDALYSHEELTAIADELGIAYPWQGGVVRFARLPTSIPGVTFQAAGTTIGQVADAFYYDASAERYSWELEATTDVPLAPFLPLSEGGFAEVPAGVQEFELGGTARDCFEVSWGWPGAGPNRIRLPVRDGYIVYGSMRCE